MAVPKMLVEWWVAGCPEELQVGSSQLRCSAVAILMLVMAQIESNLDDICVNNLL